MRKVNSPSKSNKSESNVTNADTPAQIAKSNIGTSSGSRQKTPEGGTDISISAYCR